MKQKSAEWPTGKGSGYYTSSSVKNFKKLDTLKIAVIILKFVQSETCPKDADWMADNVDTGQTIF